MRLGPFDLRERIGRGGMGAVYRAIHDQTGVDVALKVLPPGARAGASDAFRREVQAHARLVHPHIVYLFDSGQVPQGTLELQPGSPWVAMELAEHGSLREAPPPTDWVTLRDRCLQVLDALAFAHARGVVHRDLKPGNLLLCAGDVVKLADFGIAHAIGSETTDASFSGTPAYASPEQIEGDWRALGPWTDIYALGCIVWEWVCGRAPFKGTSTLDVLTRHVLHPRPALEPRFEVPLGLAAWVQTAMAVDPSARFQRAADAAHALVRLLLESTGLRDGLPPGQGAVHGAPTIEDGPALATTLGPTLRFDFRAETVRGPVIEGMTVLGGAEGVAMPPAAPIPPDWRPASTDPPPQLAGTGLGLFGLRDTPFVDRDDAREVIWRDLRSVSSTGEPAVVLIVGDAGTGKSRLVEWITVRAHELGAASVLEASHAPAGAPSYGLAGLVRRAFSSWGMSRDELLERLMARLPSLGPHDTTREADCRALVELATPDETPETRAFHFQGQSHRFAVISRVLSRLARHRAAIAWLDDVQWSADSLALLLYVVEEAVPPPGVLFIATIRADVLAESARLRARVDRLTAHRAVRRIDLSPLQRQDHEQLLSRTLPLAPAVVTELADRTEGNPLFAVQLLRDKVERGELHPAEDGLSLDRRGTGLPHDIHDLWLGRLQRLIERVAPEREGAAWEAVEWAAALGRTVDGAEWEVVCERVGVVDIGRLLTRLMVDRGLARWHGEGWEFAHGLLVDSIAERAKQKGCWARRHLACLSLLDDMYPAQGDAAIRRAQHMTAGGQPERALEVLFAHATKLRRQDAELEAAHVVLLRRAALLDELAIGEDDPRRLENDLELVPCRLIAGDSPSELLREFESLWERVDRHGTLDSRLIVRRAAAVLHGFCGAYAQARQAAEQGLELARQHGDVHGEALSWFQLAEIEVFDPTGDAVAAASFYERAGEMAVRAGSQIDSLRAFHGAGRAALTLRQCERARTLFLRGYEGAKKHGQRSVEAACLTGLGEVARLEGDSSAARSYYAECLAVLRDSGRPADRAVALVNRALAEVMDRSFAAAEATTAEAAAEWAPLPSTPFGLSYQLIRLVCAASREDWRAFDESLSAFDDLATSGGRRVYDHPWLLEVAGVEAARGGDDGRARIAWQAAARLWEILGDEESKIRLGARLGPEAESQE